MHHRTYSTVDWVMWWAMFAVLAVFNGVRAVNADLKVQRLMHAFTCIMCAGIAVWDLFK